jgi:hypothetical protein
MSIWEEGFVNMLKDLYVSAAIYCNTNKFYCLVAWRSFTPVEIEFKQMFIKISYAEVMCNYFKNKKSI